MAEQGLPPKTEAVDDGHDNDAAFEQKVEATRVALSERYRVPLEELLVIETLGENGEMVTTIIQASPNGLDPAGNPSDSRDPKRSYDSLEKNPRYTMEINGEEIHTLLSEENLPAFEAMIQQTTIDQNADKQDLRFPMLGKHVWVMGTADIVPTEPNTALVLYLYMKETKGADFANHREVLISKMVMHRLADSDTLRACLGVVVHR